MTNIETKAKRKAHRRRELNRPTPNRSQPVEGLDGRGHGDEHRGHGERRAEREIHAADKHVVTPDDEAKKRDGDDGVDHRLVTEDRLSREDRDDVGGETHGRKNQDVNLRMPEEPEEVLPKQRLAAAGRPEEARSHVEIAEEHRRSGRKHGHGENEQNRGNEQRPHRQWHAEHAHARATHIDNGRDVVGRARDGRQAVDENGDSPETLPHLRPVVGAHRAQRSIRRPTGPRRAARNEKRAQQKNTGEKIQPIADLIEQRKRHVPCPDLKGNEKVSERPDEKRHDHKEDHDRGMHGHQHVIAARDNRAVGRDRSGQEMADDRHRRVRPGELIANKQERARLPGTRKTAPSRNTGLRSSCGRRSRYTSGRKIPWDDALPRRFREEVVLR